MNLRLDNPHRRFNLIIGGLIGLGLLGFIGILAYFFNQLN